MAYKYEDRIKILEYVRDVGLIAAVRHFRVSTSTIAKWNQMYNIYSVQTKRTFTDKQKRAILDFAFQHGLTNAMHHYDVSMTLIRNWATEFGKTTRFGHHIQCKYSAGHKSESYKITVLEYAKIHGPCAASRDFNVPRTTLVAWNEVYNIYPVRARRKFTEAEKQEILEYAKNNSWSAATRKYKIAPSLVRIWRIKQSEK